MKKIVTCIDGSVFAQDVCNAGIWAAQTLSQPLVLLHALEKDPHGTDDNLSGAIGLGARSALLAELTELDAQRNRVAMEMGKDMLASALSIAQQQGLVEVETIQRHGGLTDTLIDMAETAQMIVVGRSGESHGHAFKALGSHIEQLVRQVHVPILIANRDFGAPTEFMVAYDGRENADALVNTLTSNGLLQGAKCHLVCIKAGYTNQKDNFQAAQMRLQEHGYQTQASYLEGTVFETLMAYKKQHNLGMVVMGTFSHSALREVFMGSTTLRMMENTHVPMIIS